MSTSREARKKLTANFKELKSAIAECHVQPKNSDKYQVTQALFDSSEEYLLTRADEALRTAIVDGAGDDEEFDKNIILLTRLVNIARVKRKAARDAKAKAGDPGRPGAEDPGRNQT